MTKYHITVLALLVITSVGRAQVPERTVKGSTLRSEHDPKITLELKGPVQYVGADRWELYGNADAEVHLFVEADSSKKVSRFYWIQFEAYLPSHPFSQYNGYTSPVHADIGGFDFIVDGGVRGAGGTTRPGSDREHIMKLLAAKGYTLPDGMIMRRMVHLPTADRRKELMIIYAEDVAITGYTVADLSQGGKAEAELPRLESEQLKRALERIKAKAISD